MDYIVLTPNAEKLLKEILDNRFDDGSCNLGYWENRFESLSATEHVQLCSTFKELSDAEIILNKWANNALDMLIVLNKGLSYFDIKKTNEKKEKKAKTSGRIHDTISILIEVIPGFIKVLLSKLFGIGG